MRARALILMTGLALSAGSVVQPIAVADPTAPPTTSLFTSVNPVRVLDTREGTSGPVGPGATITLDLSSRLPATATAVVLNITGTGPTASTFVIVHPSGIARPDTTNLSLAAGETRASLATTALHADRRLALFNNTGSVHLVADLTGYYATDTGSKYRTVPPIRILDTRSDGGPVGPDSSRSVDLSAKVPAGATAVAFNLTGTNPTAWTFVTAWPHGTARPWTSNLNLITAGQTSPNLVVLAVGADRGVDLYNYAGGVDLIVDLVGYYGADADSVFNPVDPRRDMDTRTGQGLAHPATPGPLTPNGYRTYQVLSAFADTNTVVFNLTGTGTTAAMTFISVFQAGGGGPATSNLNLVAGQTATNLVMSPVKSELLLYNQAGKTHLIGDVAGYFTRTCAGVRGCAYAWGANTRGQLGDGSADERRSTPKPVPNLPGVVAVASGKEETLALRDNGTVFAWGTSVVVPGGTSPVPVQVPGLSSVVKISAGYRNGLALKSDGTVWAWGDGSYGQIGDGVDYGAGAQPIPTRVSGLTDVVAVAAGWGTQYAVRSDGTVWAWGDNSHGQLGNGTTCPTGNPGACASNVPVQVSGLTDVVEVSEDGYALKSDGTIWTWGGNTAGVLGIGNDSYGYSAVVPARVPGLTGVAKINGSDHNRYALKSDGTVWAWGDNLHGQLGNGTTGGSASSPVQVALLTDARSIASGEADNGYAVTSDGSVWSWGWNPHGQLGIPTTTGQSAVPVQVLGLTGVTQVTGYFHGAIALIPHAR